MREPLPDPATVREAVRAHYAATATALSQASPSRADHARPVGNTGCCASAPTASSSRARPDPCARPDCCATADCCPTPACGATPGSATSDCGATSGGATPDCGATPGGATPNCCATPDSGILARELYAMHQLAELPPAAVRASLGCGNPTALADLQPGETVLDLGSGGGIDVLLAARRVGPTGFAFGLDMTDQMLLLAQRNAAEAGLENVRFLKGEIEHIPLPDASVDVVMSNCVINLSTDKGRVLREAFRVLRPGGRLAISDVVVQGDLPAGVRHSLEHWVGCVAGAIDEATYRRLLADAGFSQTQEVRVESMADLDATGGRLVSAFVHATKPRG